MTGMFRTCRGWMVAGLFVGFAVCVQAQLPQIGAQVFIEPGQTPEDVEQWFQILEENKMPVCRIRMFEAHMRRADGSYDFSLYDAAFRAAERHHVKVFATLFPIDDTVGGFKYPRSKQHLAEIAAYVKTLVAHFREFPALYAWVLQNEPGTGGSYTESDLAKELRATWKAQQPVEKPGRFRETHFDYEEFQRYYTTWFLNWYAEQVKALDPNRQLHVNNHAIFSNLPEYDFPKWRNFLSTLGASAHPSWHFTMFRRDQYTLAMAANNDIIRAGAGSLPFWLTELQGGNNLYSGGRAMCPTAEETTQWLWTTLGCGAKGVIFWSLNQRATIDEPGEWGLITFQRKASDRLLAARTVIESVQAHPELFTTTHHHASGVTLLVTRESFWTDKKQRLGGNDAFEARRGNAGMKSTMAWYEALMCCGISAEIMEMDWFDWNKVSYRGQTIVLSHQISIPERWWKPLERFVERGGRLIVEGVTGYFDEHQVCIMQNDFPLKKLLGGEVSEFKALDAIFPLEIEEQTLQVHLWRGEIVDVQEPGNVRYIQRNTFGAGETLWIPSPIALGALQSSGLPFVLFVDREFAALKAEQPVYFKTPEPLMVLKTLDVPGGYVTVVVNKGKKRKVNFKPRSDLAEAQIVFADKQVHLKGNSAAFGAEETLVLFWPKRVQ